jgi:tRNA(Ile2) C34 agmatinyltransferase TiaS
MIYIGIDDTDDLTSRGTGNLARLIASELMEDHHLLGVTRHQLLIHPNIAYTAKNSCAAICLQGGEWTSLTDLFNRVKRRISEAFVFGSDPGVCMASSQTAYKLVEFGRRAQREVVDKDEALHLAGKAGAQLESLGGDGSGVIGALAAAGLAASGEDGRYIMVGRSREISGYHLVKDILDTGISTVCTTDGKPVLEGFVLADKLRPARRGSQPVLFVEREDDHWLPLKLD